MPPSLTLFTSDGLKHPKLLNDSDNNMENKNFNFNFFHRESNYDLIINSSDERHG